MAGWAARGSVALLIVVCFAHPLVCMQQGALRAAEPDVWSNRRRITPAMLVEDTRRLCRILYWKHIGPSSMQLQDKYALFTYRLANAIFQAKQLWRRSSIQAYHSRITTRITHRLQDAVGSSKEDAQLVASLWPLAAATVLLCTSGLIAASIKAHARRSM